MKTHISIKISILLAVVMLCCMNSTSAATYQVGSFDPVRPNLDYWTCYDYSIDFARENPEWGVVTVSNNPNFIGLSHMLNYQIVNHTISFYDPYWSETTGNEFAYTVNISDRQSDNQYFYPCYYKFWSENETPLRNYKLLLDNSEDVLRE